MVEHIYIQMNDLHTTIIAVIVKTIWIDVFFEDGMTSDE